MKINIVVFLKKVLVLAFLIQFLIHQLSCYSYYEQRKTEIKARLKNTNNQRVCSYEEDKFLSTLVKIFPFYIANKDKDIVKAALTKCVSKISINKEKYRDEAQTLYKKICNDRLDDPDKLLTPQQLQPIYNIMATETLSSIKDDICYANVKLKPQLDESDRQPVINYLKELFAGFVDIIPTSKFITSVSNGIHRNDVDLRRITTLTDINKQTRGGEDIKVGNNNGMSDTKQNDLNLNPFTSDNQNNYSEKTGSPLTTGYENQGRTSQGDNSQKQGTDNRNQTQGTDNSNKPGDNSQKQGTDNRNQTQGTENSNKPGDNPQKQGTDNSNKPGDNPKKQDSSVGQLINEGINFANKLFKKRKLK
jgi:hypothetical protein